MAEFEDGLQYDDEEPRYWGMRLGQVVKRDPDLKRVKILIPGFIEPESPWAYPLGAGAGGSINVGLIGVPRVGAEVAVWFANGDIERPYYLPANWGEEEIPESVAGKVDAVIWSSETFEIVFDETEGQRLFVIRNKKTNDELLFNPEENSITLTGTTSINIEALGQVNIDGAVVQIKGRKVLPTGEPI